jgi:hypothetical protein
MQRREAVVIVHRIDICARSEELRDHDHILSEEGEVKRLLPPWLEVLLPVLRRVHISPSLEKDVNHLCLAGDGRIMHRSQSQDGIFGIRLGTESQPTLHRHGVTLLGSLVKSAKGPSVGRSPGCGGLGFQ